MKRTKLKLVIFISYVFINCGYAQVLPIDSFALVSLYNSTNGQNWTDNTNWLTGPVSTWYGITTINPNISVIDLSNNNLTGTLPQELGNIHYLFALLLYTNNLTGSIPPSYFVIPQLQAIALTDNHLTGTIPLSSGSSQYLNLINFAKNDLDGPIPDTLMKRVIWMSLSLDSNKFESLNHYPDFHNELLIQVNKLTFKDIVPYCLENSLNLFQYAPQDSVKENIDTTIYVGDNISFSSWVDTCHNNRYRWLKNLAFITPLDTMSVLNVNNAQTTNSGTYGCYIVNSDAPLLTLYRRSIYLHVVDTTVGISEKEEMKVISVNFNPDNQLLKININSNNQEPVNCNLYDLWGRRVLQLYQGIASKQELKYYMNRVNINPGLYIVRINIGSTYLSKKILITYH